MERQALESLERPLQRSGLPIKKNEAPPHSLRMGGLEQPFQAAKNYQFPDYRPYNEQDPETRIFLVTLPE